LPGLSDLIKAIILVKAQALNKKSEKKREICTQKLNDFILKCMYKVLLSDDL